MKTVLDRLTEHLVYARWYYSLSDIDWFVIAANGSHNYNTNDQESDIDSYLLVFPTLDQIVFDTKPVSKVLNMRGSQEYIDIKDVRHFFKILNKGNMNFLEILFSDYYIVNPIYQQYWDKIVENREHFAYAKPHTTVDCAIGMAKNKLKAMLEGKENRSDVFYKFGYDPKELHHIVRLYLFLEQYTQQKPYKECIMVPDHHKNHMTALKRNGDGLTKEQAEKLAKIYISKMEQLKSKMDFDTLYSNVNQIYLSILDGMMRNYLKIAL